MLLTALAAQYVCPAHDVLSRTLGLCRASGAGLGAPELSIMVLPLRTEPGHSADPSPATLASRSGDV